MRSSKSLKQIQASKSNTAMKETSEARSRIMRAVKSRDTAPEMTVRRLAHGMGYVFGFAGRTCPAARI